MVNLADHLSYFLREYLPCERRASTHTIEAYAYTFQLLICFSARYLKVRPSKLTLDDLNASLIVRFLNALENSRGNTSRTRNARLAAIKSFFRLLEYRIPSVLEQSRQIHAIPSKKVDEKLVDYLTREEMQGLLDAPNINSVSGLRDRAMIYLAFAAGLRVSELVSLPLNQVNLGPETCIHVLGKGRRERVIPLWKETSMALRDWLAVRDKHADSPECFLNAQGKAMTRSGFKYILSKYVKIAAKKLPSLAKKNISPHALRHTCAILTLQATHDIRKVSLWLGHSDIKTTEIYLRADYSDKISTLMSGNPLSLKKGKFKAPDKLIAMLQSSANGKSYVQ